MTKVTRDQLRDEIRRAGLRATAHRIAVLEVLHAERTPLSHGEIAERLTAVCWDRSTVYRNLVDLVGAGLAQRSELGDRLWRYGRARATHGRPHSQFTCTGCGNVAHLPALALGAGRVKTPRAVRQGQFEIKLRGLCDSCARLAEA